MSSYVSAKRTPKEGDVLQAGNVFRLVVACNDLAEYKPRVWYRNRADSKHGTDFVSKDGMKWGKQIETSLDAWYKWQGLNRPVLLGDKGGY